MNVLVTDIVFPNKFARWRNLEVIAFIEKYSADILVNHLTENAGVAYEVDYNHKIFSTVLDGYEFLIFDANYNYLNKYNKRIDGTLFNGMSSFSYLLTKKEIFDITTYDIVYHIFLHLYNIFNDVYKFPYHKQVIHLYPGGSYDGVHLDIPQEVHLVSTSPITTNHISGLTNNYIDCWLGPFLRQGDEIPVRAEHLTKEWLTVCFASLGSGLAKGDELYIALVELYQKAYPDDKVKYISIGNCASHSLIKNYPAMDYQSLSEFYATEVDIYVNLETGYSFNGWPLGLEAGIQGSIILTTDSYGQRPYYGIDDNTIPVCNSVADFAEFIHILVHDRNRMQSIKLQFKEFITQYISYDAQQLRIFNFLDQIHTNNQNPLLVNHREHMIDNFLISKPLNRLQIHNITIIKLIEDQRIQNIKHLDSVSNLKSYLSKLKDANSKLKDVINHNTSIISTKNQHIIYLEKTLKEYETQIISKNIYISVLEQRISYVEKNTAKTYRLVNFITILSKALDRFKGIFIRSK